MVKIINAILVLIIIVGSSYVATAMYMYANQGDWIFFPTGEYTVPPSTLNIKEVSLTTKDNVTLHGWWMKTNSARKTVVFFHGNAGNVSDRIGQMEIFSRLGFNALSIDYRGYGKSQGEIQDEKDLYLDGQAAVEYVMMTQKIPADDIVVWGRSLGGAVAAHVSQGQDFAGLVLEATFSSLDDIAKERFWFLPVDMLLKFHFDTISTLNHVNAPVLIIHSRDDDIVPFTEGEKVFANASEPKQFLAVHGTHNDYVVQSFEAYFTTIDDFLTELFPPPPSPKPVEPLVVPATSTLDQVTSTVTIPSESVTTTQ